MPMHEGSRYKDKSTHSDNPEESVVLVAASDGKSVSDGTATLAAWVGIHCSVSNSVLWATVRAEVYSRVSGIQGRAR